MQARILLVLACLLLPFHALASAPGAVEARGKVDAYCHLVATTAQVHLAMVRESPGRWQVQLEALAPGCGQVVLDSCVGKGLLHAGVSLGECKASGGSGSFGPVVVCIGGPQAPPPAYVTKTDFDFGAPRLSLSGTLEVTLLGDAVAEANLCV